MTRYHISQVFHHRRADRPGDIHADGRPLLSWRVALLQRLEVPEAPGLYPQFRLNEPWDSPHNLTLIPKIPQVYQSVGDPAGWTAMLGVAGPGTMMPAGGGMRMSTVQDGVDLTVSLVEADAAVEWTRPSDYLVDWTQPRRGLGQRRKGQILVATARGTTHALKANVPDSALAQLFSVDGAALGQTGTLDPTTLW